MAGECKVDVSALNGCYAWRGQGTDTGNIPIAAVGYWYFLRGTVSGQYTGMHGINTVTKTLKGTLSTNADGTGRITAKDNTDIEEILDFVTAAGGTVLYLVHKRSGTTATSEARKV